MDRMLYVAMTGARQTLSAQSVNAHNLANASTTGFRADLHRFDAVPVAGTGFASRINSVATEAGADLTTGPMHSTGRDLDIAIQGEGWIAVQSSDGGETYTRAGDLRITTGGVLTNGTGEIVLGNGGPVAVPPYEQLVIGGDGSISIVPVGQGPATLAVVDRIRLVNPAAETLVKGEDGRIRTADGSVPEADASVQVMAGVLEGSNVNAVQSMISMIELNRQFELQVKMMKTADDNAGAAGRLVQMS